MALIKSRIKLSEKIDSDHNRRGDTEIDLGIKVFIRFDPCRDCTSAGWDKSPLGIGEPATEEGNYIVSADSPGLKR